MRPLAPEEVPRLSLLHAEQELVDAISAPAVIVNQRGLVVGANSKMERLFGYRHTELLGQRIELLMLPREVAHHQRYIENDLSTGKSKM